MKKVKKMLYIILTIIIIFVGGYFLFVNFYPSFGGKMSKERQQRYKKSTQFEKGKFVNTDKRVPHQLGTKEMLKLAYKFFTTKVENGRPSHDLIPIKLDSKEVSCYKNKNARLIWFGHSAFLLQIDGKNLLLDPMFGKVSAPLELLGDKRFNSELPLEIETLPNIDAIVISHDHYDHLDYKSILKLKDKTEHFFTPLGVGIHLEAWGIKPENITELDWWQETEFKNLKLVCTPAQHFSGRKMGNKPSTLWSSWVIQSENENLFFSGDSGYSPHFKEIGKKYGEFDLALMECGQYNKLWHDIHCMPEETAQAGVDLKAKRIMPIHWAGFKLALHDWRDPIIRVLKKAKELNLTVITPKIGEKVVVSDTAKVYSKWWEEL